MRVFFFLFIFLPLWFDINAFDFPLFRFAFVCTNPKYAQVIISKRTRVSRVFSLLSSSILRFAFTFVTPVTFSLVLFLFPFLLYRLEVPIDIPRAHSFLETSSFGGGIRRFFFPFFQRETSSSSFVSFRYVLFRFVSFKSPPTSFWWRSFFAYDSLIRTVNTFNIYIYISCFFFFFFIFLSNELSVVGERETHKTCIFVFLPHPCVFLSGTRETSSVNSTTPG